MQGVDICSCIPEKICTALSVSHGVRGDVQKECSYCNQTLTPNMYGDTYLYGCHRTRGRVHFIPVWVCDRPSNCKTKFEERLKTMGILPYVDRLRGVAFATPRSTLENCAETYRKNHRRTLEVCNACRLMEETTLKFKICGGCKYTRYCSPECQRQDWAKHKSLCSMKQQNPPTDPVVIPTFKLKPCPCFNAYQTHLHNVHNTDLCSYMDCTNRCVPPYEFLFNAKPCADGNGVHFFPTHYCSAKCRKRCVNDKRQNDKK